MGLIIALRHVAFEDLDVFETALRARGHDVAYLNAWEADWAAIAAAQPALLAILGGPIGVYDVQGYPFLVPEIAAVERWIDAGGACLGLCLGAQVIAASQGCAVYPAGVKEIGLADLRLTDAGRTGVLADFAAAPTAFHWHGDTFDLPPSATLLASTDAVANQAFALGESTLAFQFHPEVDLARIESWLVGHACELAQAGVDVVALRAEAAAHAQAMRIKAQSTAGRIMDHLGL